MYMDYWIFHGYEANNYQIYNFVNITDIFIENNRYEHTVASWNCRE